MLRAENDRLSRQFTENFRGVLKSCNTDAKELKRIFEKGPTGNAKEAIAVTQSLEKQVEHMQKHVPVLTELSENTPPAGRILEAALSQMNAVESILDLFEKRVAQAYGVKPVVVPELEHKRDIESNPTSTDTNPSALICEVSEAPMISIPEDGSSTPLAKSPERVEAFEVEAPMPATPRPEDFGICDADVRALAAPSPAGFKPDNLAVDGTPRYQMSMARATGIPMIEDGENYDEVVQKSMSALGIETPVEVEQKFATRRNEALRGVMQTTTPRMKAGGTERTLDYTGLAGGYYGSTRKDKLHRALDFDDTTMGMGTGVQKQIADLYGGIEEAWRERVPCETLQEAAMLLSQEERRFSKSELLDFLGDAFPGKDCDVPTVVLCLKKMSIIRLETRHGAEASYRFVS